MKALIQPLKFNDYRAKNDRLDSLVQFAGYRPNALLTMARIPDVVPRLLDLLEVTLRGPGLFSEDFRFLIASEASRGAKCIYTATHLVHIANHLGVSWEKIDELPIYMESNYYDEREVSALAIATAGGTLPVKDSTNAISRAKMIYSDDEIAELVSCIAMVGWFNRWNGLMKSELEDVPSEALKHVSWLANL